MVEEVKKVKEAGSPRSFFRLLKALSESLLAFSTLSTFSTFETS